MLIQKFLVNFECSDILFAYTEGIGVLWLNYLIRCFVEKCYFGRRGMEKYIKNVNEINYKVMECHLTSGQ